MRAQGIMRRPGRDLLDQARLTNRLDWKLLVCFAKRTAHGPKASDGSKDCARGTVTDDPPPRTTKSMLGPLRRIW